MTDKEDFKPEDDIQEAFQKQYGMRAPDLILGITPEGFANAVAAQLTKDEIVPEGHFITGVITTIDFGEDGHLPLGVYLEKVPDKGSLQ